MKNTPEDLNAVTHAFPWISHPEGGAYVETYRSPISHHFESHDGMRSVCTAIYFLLQKNEYSGFHKIKSDELWHFYGGGGLEVLEIDEEGKLLRIAVGPDVLGGEKLQHVVKAGRWFASRPLEQSLYSLVGCTVAPGFEYQDFELASAEKLMALYPEHRSVIRELCRK